jgi:hypothetical protein
MRLISSSILALTIVLLGSTALSADIIELKDGRSVAGRVLLFDGKHVRIALVDRVEAFAVEDVSLIRFGETPAATTTVEIPAGTLISVLTAEAIDSRTAADGQTFKATLDEDLVINGAVVQAAGVPAVLGLTSVRVARGLTGKTEVTLSLVSVSVGGRMVAVKTEALASSSQGKGADTAKKTAGLAAIGAVAGQLLGGRAGAVTGGIIGGAGGLALTKTPRVVLQAETKLSFTVQ